MADAKLMLVVAAALVDDEGRVLMQQRPPGKSHAGLWEFPGGKVEPGEAPAAALARELAEELGVAVEPGDVEPLAFADEAAPTPFLLLLYLVRRWQGEPRALEASALTWGAPTSLAALPMPPADRPLLAALARRLG